MKTYFGLKTWLFYVLCLVLTGFHEEAARAESSQKYYLRTFANNLQAYWKDDELIIGINVQMEGKTAAGTSGSTVDEYSTPEKTARIIHVVVVKKGKSEFYQVPAEQTSDDTVYPYEGTVYLKMSNTKVFKLAGNSFRLADDQLDRYSDLWTTIINQPLEQQGWKVFSLWDEGQDEIEFQTERMETCRISLGQHRVYLNREMRPSDPDDRIFSSRYFLTGLTDPKILVFADFTGKFKPVTQQEYERVFSRKPK
jgi:hypothetical protein